MKIKMQNIILSAGFLSFLAAATAQAQLKVIDGDSLMLGKTEIRLSGIDAPEYHQPCYDKDDKPYPCGKLSFEALKALVSPQTRCDKVAVDKYHRQVSVCWDRDININQKMVEMGQAVAYKRYTNEYAKAEEQAKKQKVGIWQGRFMKPEFYRILQKEKKNHNL